MNRMPCILLCLGLSLQPMQAQFWDSIVNPDVQVLIKHPPYLGLKVSRIAFVPGESRVTEDLIAALMDDFSRSRQIEVIDRANLRNILYEQDLAASGTLDPSTTARLGKLLGPAALVTVRVHNYHVERRPLKEKKERKDAKGNIVPYTLYTSTTQVEMSASVQVTDLTTGKVHAARRFSQSPTKALSSETGPPLFPSETEVREACFSEIRSETYRMILPWTEERKLIFYDDREYGMKEAYKRLAAGDYEGAIARSQDALRAAKADPQVRSKYLGRTYYNLGMAFFVNGEYEEALVHLKEARGTDSGHRIFRDAAAECERAIQLAQDLHAIEQKSDPTPKPKAQEGAGTLEERLERLKQLRDKQLITEEEFRKRKEELLQQL